MTTPWCAAQDLLRGLAAHAVAYKKQAPYNYKCRKLFPALGAPARASFGFAHFSPIA